MTVRIAAGLALASVTLAAAAAGPSPQVNPVRNSAVGYALTLDRVADSFAGRCGTVDRESARVARAGWTERNGELVKSADRYLDFVKRLVKHERGEEAAQRFYEDQKKAFASRAQLTVIDSLLDGRPERDVCTQVLEAMANGRMDLAAPAYRGALEEIRSELGAASR